jgi:DNA-binding NarL/FixJ family response regulator
MTTPLPRYTPLWATARKSAVCKLLEAGCTHKEVAAVTGHSLGQIEHYSKSADQLKLNEAAMRQWERA